MSIAVSAVVRPSRSLRLSLASFAVLNLGAGLALASGLLGAFVYPHWIGGACAVAAGCAGYSARRPGMTRQIDISGLGEIHVTVQQNMRTGGAQRVLVTLLPGSTLWPRCLLLLLRQPEGGPIVMLMVSTDSVARVEFQAIALAIRTIARRDNKFNETHKIL